MPRRRYGHHLRHHPERLGLIIAPGGWVDVHILLAACRGHHFYLTLAELEEVVRRNDKQRFSFDETGQRIRANQGHSIKVDLHLEPAMPPPILYHGTGEGKVQSSSVDGSEGLHGHELTGVDMPRFCNRQPLTDPFQHQRFFIRKLIALVILPEEETTLAV